MSKYVNQGQISKLANKCPWVAKVLFVTKFALSTVE